MPEPLERRLRVDRTAPAVLSILGLSQALYLGASGSRGALAISGIIVGIAAALAGLPGPQLPSWRKAFQVPLAAALLVTFVAFVMTSPTPFPKRLALVALLLAFAATAAGLALRLAFRVKLLPITLGVWLITSPLIFIEALAGRDLPRPADPLMANLEPVPAPAPDSSGRYAPHSVRSASYPDDLAGYIASTTGGERQWELVVLDSSAAELEFPAGPAQTTRVRIDRTSTDVSWNVQLVKEPLHLEKGREYVLAVSVRADSRRPVWVHVTQGRAPGAGLGLSASLDADSIWRAHRLTFRSTESDSAARLRLDLSLSTIPVEVRDAVLRDASTQQRIEPAGAGKAYTISYRFNAFGCRGPDYPVPGDTGVTRILVLGDSYTLGAGVMESDAYPSRLDRLLNADGRRGRPVTRYEVINCGVAGYGARDSRLFYEELARRYDPDLVILGMVAGDEARRTDDLPLEGGWSAGRLGQLFASSRYLSRRREEPGTAPPDLSDMVREVDSLRALVRSDSGRFAVVLLQDRSSRRWTQLDSTITAAFPDSTVPVLNVGPRLLILPPESRTVHPVVDRHPNHVVHRIIAEAIGPFLIQQVLVASDTSEGRADSARGRR